MNNHEASFIDAPKKGEMRNKENKATYETLPAYTQIGTVIE